jgi:hypothetical protein
MNVVKWTLDISLIFLEIFIHRWGMWHEKDILGNLFNKRTVGVNEESATHTVCSSLNPFVLCSVMGLVSLRCRMCSRKDQDEGQPSMTCSETHCHNGYYNSREYNALFHWTVCIWVTVLIRLKNDYQTHLSLQRVINIIQILLQYLEGVHSFFTWCSFKTNCNGRTRRYMSSWT